MNVQKKIEAICRGKSLRIFSARDDRTSVSLIESYRNCGKRNCARCKRKSSRPHGPYWTLNYLDENGRPRTLYVGKRLPDIASPHSSVLFSDVLRFYAEREKHNELISRYKEEMERMKQEIERLFEEIRTLRRTDRRKNPVRTEKFFHQLVMKYHPDRNAHRTFHSEEVMKDINQLYQHVR
jgi:hypothetical protein